MKNICLIVLLGLTAVACSKQVNPKTENAEVVAEEKTSVVAQSQEKQNKENVQKVEIVVSEEAQRKTDEYNEKMNKRSKVLDGKW